MYDLAKTFMQSLLTNYIFHFVFLFLMSGPLAQLYSLQVHGSFKAPVCYITSAFLNPCSCK